MKHEHVNEIKGIIILACGLILLASLISFVPEDLPWYASQPNIPVKNLIKHHVNSGDEGIFFRGSVH